MSKNYTFADVIKNYNSAPVQMVTVAGVKVNIGGKQALNDTEQVNAMHVTDPKVQSQVDLKAHIEQEKLKSPEMILGTVPTFPLPVGILAAVLGGFVFIFLLIWIFF